MAESMFLKFAMKKIIRCQVIINNNLLYCLVLKKYRRPPGQINKYNYKYPMALGFRLGLDHNRTSNVVVTI